MNKLGFFIDNSEKNIERISDNIFYSKKVDFGMLDDVFFAVSHKLTKSVGTPVGTRVFDVIKEDFLDG